MLNSRISIFSGSFRPNGVEMLTRLFLSMTLFLVCCIGLAACGGGGGNNGGNNEPPVADDGLEWDNGNWDEEDWE